jgi:hypothetical protein
METAYSSKISVFARKAAGCHTPENNYLNNYHLEKPYNIYHV